MKTTWSLSDDPERKSLASALTAGEYYDLKTYGGTRGCQVFQGVTVGGNLKFFNQFAHDGFGAVVEYAATDLIRVWQ